MRLYQTGTSRTILRPRTFILRSRCFQDCRSTRCLPQAPGEALLEQEFASTAILARPASKISSGSNPCRWGKHGPGSKVAIDPLSSSSGNRQVRKRTTLARSGAAGSSFHRLHRPVLIDYWNLKSAPQLSLRPGRRQASGALPWCESIVYHRCACRGARSCARLEGGRSCRWSSFVLRGPQDARGGKVPSEN